MNPRKVSWKEDHIPVPGDSYLRLTDRQREVLDVIQDYIDRHDFAPSVRDIMEKTGVSSTSTVAYHLNVLEEMGCIKREPKTARSIRVLQ